MRKATDEELARWTSPNEDALTDQDQEDVYHDNRLIRRFQAGDITRGELEYQSRIYQPMGVLDYMLNFAAAIPGALAEIRHREFTEDEILTDTVAALDPDGRQ